MGCRRELLCPACGYTAEVSGAPDDGFCSSTITVVCADCRALFDVPTATRDYDGAPDWREVTPRCPRRRTHRITEWTCPGTCPRCHAIMEAGPGMGVLWD